MVIRDPLHTALHHSLIVLIWLEYCWKGRKVACHVSSIQLRIWINFSSSWYDWNIVEKDVKSRVIYHPSNCEFIWAASLKKRVSRIHNSNQSETPCTPAFVLCFVLCRFLSVYTLCARIVKVLIRLRVCAGWSEPLQFEYTSSSHFACCGLSTVPERQIFQTLIKVFLEANGYTFSVKVQLFYFCSTLIWLNA